MGWIFDSRHDEVVTHGRILDAVERCQHDVNKCAESIAVIHATLTSGGDKTRAMEQDIRQNSLRINALDMKINGSSAVGQFARGWILPITLATLGTVALLFSGLLWLGDRLDDDTRQPLTAPNPPAEARR